MTIQQFKQNAISRLSANSPSAQLDVQVLMEFALNCSKTQLLLRKDDEIPTEKLKWLEAAIEKRSTGLPVAYITGHKEFYGFDFLVSPAVLIPKPDTEILVERAVELILESMELHPERILTICDMCAGSGCIGLAVLKTLAETYDIPADKLPKITFADISGAALEVAEKNFAQLFGTNRDKLDCLLMLPHFKLKIQKQTNPFKTFCVRVWLLYKQIFLKQCPISLILFLQTRPTFRTQW